MQKAKHPLSVFLLLVGLLLLLSSCGGTSSAPARPTPRPSEAGASATAGATSTTAPTPGVARLPYPWPMVAAPRNTPPWTALPSESVRGQVLEEQTSDLRAFWAWIGYARPVTVLHFQPDASQLARFVYGSYQQTVIQALAEQARSGQLVTYATSDFTLQLEGCKEDGLTCKALLSLGLVRKIIFDTNTGQMLSETPPAGQAPQYGVVGLTLQYDKEGQQWQIAALQIVLGE